MSRLGVVDPDQLPVFAVIETIDVDKIIDARMERVVVVWKEHDPPAGAAYDVEGLEFDPIKIVEEADAYFELLLRDRVNQAARAVTLAYAVGGDLDAIASRYPGGCPRLPGEDDERYRRRIWLSPSTLSPHGTEEAYVFWALTADKTLKDATATTVEGTGHVSVTCMASGSDPRPTDLQLNAVRAFIHEFSRKGLTDIVSVLPPKVIETQYVIDVWLYPGPDANVTMKALRDSLDALIEKESWLGFDHTRMAIATACGYVNGVQNVHIRQPERTIVIDPRSVVKVTAVELELRGQGA